MEPVALEDVAPVQHAVVVAEQHVARLHRHAHNVLLARLVHLLEELALNDTHVTDAGCAALAAALDSDALPALKVLKLDGIPASDAAKAAVYEARANLGVESESESEDGESEDGESEADEEGS